MFDPNQIPWYIWLISGFLMGIGVITLLPNPIGNKITDQDNLGWWLLLSGAALLVLWFAVPFAPIAWMAIVLIWERSSVTMLVAFIVGIVLAIVGGILLKKRSRRTT